MQHALYVTREHIMQKLQVVWEIQAVCEDRSQQTEDMERESATVNR